MYPLFESIQIRNGQALHLSWHQERLNRSYYEYFGKACPFLLEALIQVPDHAKEGIFKARFVYAKEGSYLEFHPYKVKQVKELIPITADRIEYSLKYTDRSKLKELSEQLSPEQESIIIQEGNVTDSTYSNLIFRSGESWYTPETPLLAGTCRARLLAEGHISTHPIRQEDLNSFSSAKLINAMLDIEESQEIPLSL